jgi:hypothetical protein
MFHIARHVELPDCILGDEPAGGADAAVAAAAPAALAPVLSRKRKAQRQMGGQAKVRRVHQLPRSFFVHTLLSNSARVTGVIRFDQVMPWAQLVSEQPEVANDLEVQKQALGLQGEGSYCWHVVGWEAFLAVVELPKALVLKWPCVLYLKSSNEALAALHRAVGVPIGQQQFWQSSPYMQQLSDEAFAGLEWIVTSHAYIHGARVSISPSYVAIDASDGTRTPEPGEVLVHGKEFLCGGVNFFETRRGSTKIQFKTPVLLQTLRLQWALQNCEATSIAWLVKQAWRLTLPVSEVVKLEGRLLDGSLRLPAKSLLYNMNVKLDIMYSLYQPAALALIFYRVSMAVV